MIKKLAKKLNNSFLSVGLGLTQASVLSNLAPLLLKTEETQDAVGTAKQLFGMIIDVVLDIIYSIFYTLSIFVLKFIDLCEIIVYNFAGIKTNSSTVQVGIFAKLATNKVVLRVLTTLFVLGLIFVIVFTIISIVKSEYKLAIDADDAKKARVTSKALGRMGATIFLMTIMPVVLIILSIFTTTVLNSINNAFAEVNKSPTSTLGGQLFVDSAYNANLYRRYAESNGRAPILITDFSDPYENGTWQNYSSADLAKYYREWTDGKTRYNDVSSKNFASFNDTLIYKNNKVYNSKNFAGNEPFASTAEQYLAMADFMDYAVEKNLTFYIKDSSDTDIDWGFSSVDGVVVSEGVLNKDTGTIRITYTDKYGLSRYNNGYYTLDYDTGLISATTPIEDASRVIANILGVGNTEANRFKILERVEGSANIVRWQTEKAKYADEEFTVYNLKKIIFNTATQLQEVLADVKVAKRSTIASSPYYLLKEDKNSDGYYEYTTITIEYYNDGEENFDTLTPEFKYVTWPEKLANDCEVIFKDIDFDNFINYDNWADALGTYFSNSTTVTRDDVSSFSTALIHPLGLIMSELFMGVTMEETETSALTDFTFASIYSKDLLSSITKSIGGQFNYENICAQVDYFIKVFNSALTPVVESLKNIENFDVYGKTESDVQAYVYKAYLASLMLGTDFCDYFTDMAYDIINVNAFVNNLTAASGGYVYDENGKLMYKTTYVLDSDYNYALQTKVLFEGTQLYISKYVYNDSGDKVLVADEKGKIGDRSISSIGYKTRFVPRGNVNYKIVGRSYAYYFSEYSDYYTYEQLRAVKNTDSEALSAWQEKQMQYYQITDEPSQIASTLKVLVYNEEGKQITALNPLGGEVGYLPEAEMFYDQNGFLTSGCPFYLYESFTTPLTNEKYFTYNRLSKTDQQLVDKVIDYVRAEVSLGIIKKPRFLDVLEEYRAEGSDYETVLSAETINQTTAQEYEEQYDDMIAERAQAIEKRDRLYRSTGVSANNHAEIMRCNRQIESLDGKINSLKKYYLIYSMQSYLSTKMSSGVTVMVNGRGYNLGQTMGLDEFLEYMMGNRLNNATLLGSLKNGTYYSNLTKFDRNAFENIYSKFYVYSSSVNGIIDKLESRNFTLTTVELDNLNKYLEIMDTSRVYDYTNKTLKTLYKRDHEEYERMLTLLSCSLVDVPTIYKNYKNGESQINKNCVYIKSIDEAYSALYKLVDCYTNYKAFNYISDNYEGVLDDNNVAFGALKTFLKNFGNTCFELSQKTNLTELANSYTDERDLLDYVDNLVVSLNSWLKAVDFGSSVSSINQVTGIDNLGTVSYTELSMDYKNYLIVLGDYFKKEVADYDYNLEMAQSANNYLTNYMMGRYKMLNSSLIYVRYLKEYLNYFKYNADFTNREKFIKDYVYSSYGIINTQTDMYKYYEEYLNSFNGVNLNDGVYYDNLTVLQQQVIKNCAEYYAKQLLQIKEDDKIEKMRASYGLINNYIYANGENPPTFADVRQILVDNKNLLNLYNLIEFLGLDFDATATLKDYRLQALNNLVDFEEYIGESGASVQQRYLANLYLVCSGYSRTVLGDTRILLNDSTKQAILKLAGISDRPEEQLVGLTYEINNTGARSDERFGSVYIICTYNQDTRKFVPFLMSSGYNNDGVPRNRAYTSTMVDEEGNMVAMYYPVIAKGVFNQFGLPTGIRRVNGNIEFYRDDVVIRDATYLNIDTYYQSVEQISVVHNPISIIFNTVAKLTTGKTLTERLLEAVPRLVADGDLILPYGKQESVLYNLEDGSANVNYTFNEAIGIRGTYLYSHKNLNIIVLVLGSVMVAWALWNALFGLVKTLWQLVFLFAIFPGIASTFVLDDSRYKKWKDEFIPKLVVSYGFVVGLDFFFLITKMIDNVNFFSASSASVEMLQDSWTFSWVSADLLNEIAKILFFFVAVTLIQSIPDLVSKILDGDEAMGKGSQARSETKSIVANVGDYTSGRALADTFTYMAGTARSFVPGAGGLSGGQYTPSTIEQMRRNAEEKRIKQDAQDYKNRMVNEGVSKKQAEATAQAYYEAREAEKKHREEIKDHRYINYMKNQKQRAAWSKTYGADAKAASDEAKKKKAKAAKKAAAKQSKARKKGP